MDSPEAATQPSTVPWEELRPHCSCQWSDRPERGECGAPAIWWDSCANCGGITFSCDPCHDRKLASSDTAWMHTMCGARFHPARKQIAGMGRI